MNPIALILAILALGMALCLSTGAVRADELSDRSRWFKGLVVPEGAWGAGSLCCDISDGHPVEAEMRGSLWYVNRPEGWTAVPPEIVLREVSIDEQAYLFIFGGRWRCFVPPLQGF